VGREGIMSDMTKALIIFFVTPIVIFFFVVVILVIAEVVDYYWDKWDIKRNNKKINKNGE